MDRKLISGLLGAAIVLVPTAVFAAHGKAGLWNISTSMEMANMPQMPQMPPEAMEMMKARGMSMPGMPGMGGGNPLPARSA